MTRIDSGTRVTFLIGIVPIRLVTFELKVELTCLHLRLLKTEEIGIERLENITETLSLAGAQTIYIPTYKLHR
jgi:hypothetical protein